MTSLDAVRSDRAIDFSLRPLLATVIGNAAEFYDFVLYAYFATFIGHAFFPSSSPYGSLLLSLATFGAGFLTRPLGAAVIGLYADRRGRGPAMMLSIVMMGAGTGVIALVPPYASIGIAAPILVLAGRLVQGFAVGGEVGPATSFMYERAPAGRRALYSSLQGSSQGVASVVGGLFGVGLAQILTDNQLGAWGWRVPFLIGLLIIPIGLWLRRGLGEPAVSVSSVPQAAIRDYSFGIAVCVMAIMGLTVRTYVMLYMTSFALTTLHLSTGWSMMATVTAGLTGAVFSPLGGWLADRFGRLRVVAAAMVAGLIAVWPCFSLLVAQPSPTYLILTVLILGGTGGIATGGFFSMLAGRFPRRVRSTCLAVAYALSVTIFGSLTQFFVTELLAVTGDQMSPAYVLLVCGLISLGAVYLVAWHQEPD